MHGASNNMEEEIIESKNKLKFIIIESRQSKDSLIEEGKRREEIR